MLKTFYMEIENSICAVTLTAVDHPFHTMVHVVFENEYENIFFQDIECGKWIEQDLGFTELAVIVGKLAHKCELSNTTLRDIYWHHEDRGYQSLNFGFSKNETGKCTMYDIFGFNRRYMFTLIKGDSDHWQVFKITGNSKWKFDKHLIEEVANTIDVFEY